MLSNNNLRSRLFHFFYPYPFSRKGDKQIFFIFFFFFTLDRYLRYREYREKVRINFQERIEILGSSGILKRTNNLLSSTRLLSFSPSPFLLECVSSNEPVPHL